jgi:hypothetical protein
MARKRTWIEKRDAGQPPRITILDKPFAGIQAGAKLLISSPQEIDAFIRTIPKGEAIAPATLRQSLAQHHKADATCPASTGIFLRVVAEAALEEFAQGMPAEQIAPFWRAIAANSALAKKLSADDDAVTHIKRLVGE